MRAVQNHRCVVLVLVLAAKAAGVGFAQTASPEISAEPVPGQLDIMQGTAVKLGGAPPSEGPQPEGFAWEIVQGEGGALYNDDQYEAIFQAPRIDRSLEIFVIRLTVDYPGGQRASNSIHLRVHRDPPKVAEPPKETRDIEDVMTDYYRKEKAANERNKQRSKSSQATVIHHSVHTGWGWGWGGWGWGGWGWGYTPVYAPIIIPPPGTDWEPGIGEWDEPIAIPYEEVVTTFPEHIADDYLPQDYPGAERVPDMGYAGGSPTDFIEIPQGAQHDFSDPGYEAGMDDAEPMVDPGFGYDDFGW